MTEFCKCGCGLLPAPGKDWPRDPETGKSHYSFGARRKYERELYSSEENLNPKLKGVTSSGK